MSSSPPILAVIFDFDDTLVPDSTTLLLLQHEVDPQKFWTQDVKGLISSGFDPTLAYLKALLDNIGDNKPLGPLTNKDLREFGRKLYSKFYPGVPRLFRDLKKVVDKYEIEIDLEFYVLSGGLQEVIEGSKIIKDNFSGIYGCQLAGDTEDGILKYIKRCITFTEKTRYLFEINKGINPSQTQRNPYLVNKDIPEHNRRIPFRNMLYVGDGVTDIPCFSLVKKQGGMAFGVFEPTVEESAKRALLEFLKTDRVISMHAPRYRKTDELGSLLRAAVATLCSRIDLRREEVEERY